MTVAVTVAAAHWSARILDPAVLAGHGPEQLGALLVGFHAWQAAAWPRLAKAVADLAQVHTRTLTLHGQALRVQWNPARAFSTTARVDPASVRQRACFLCPANLPPEEHGLAWGEQLVVLANPAPILPLHLVLAHRQHRPQLILPVLKDLLVLPLASGGQFSAFYNGARCGASAPDHLHLQAAQAGHLPDEQATLAALDAGEWPGQPLVDQPQLRAWSVDHGRRALGFVGQPSAVADGLRHAMALLAADSPHETEPPLNLLAFTWRKQAVALLYPRGAHRPACFYGNTPRCVVSPGAIDMAGLVVTVRQQDFESIDEQLLMEIFTETSAPAARWQTLLPALKERLNHG